MADSCVVIRPNWLPATRRRKIATPSIAPTTVSTWPSKDPRSGRFRSTRSATTADHPQRSSSFRWPPLDYAPVRPPRSTANGDDFDASTRPLIASRVSRSCAIAAGCRDVRGPASISRARRIAPALTRPAQTGTTLHRSRLHRPVVLVPALPPVQPATSPAPDDEESVEAAVRRELALLPSSAVMPGRGTPRCIRRSSCAGRCHQPGCSHRRRTRTDNGCGCRTSGAHAETCL